MPIAVSNEDTSFAPHMASSVGLRKPGNLAKSVYHANIGGNYLKILQMSIPYHLTYDSRPVCAGWNAARTSIEAERLHRRQNSSIVAL